MDDSNNVRLGYTISKDLEIHAYFEDDQFKSIAVFFQTPSGDIAARKCDDKLTYEFFKKRAIRDYKQKMRGG